VAPRGQLAGDQGGIRRQHGADGEVVAFLDQVCHALADGEVDGDLRLAGEEFGDDGGEETDDVGTGVEAQRAARGGLQRTGDAVGVVELGQDLRRAVEIGMADFGEAHLAGGAVQQAHAKPVLERLDVVAHHRRGQVQAAGGRREAAGFGDAAEHREAGQPVHAIVR